MKALVFGEILHDVYEGSSTIGGAPFNFSTQLSRLIGKRGAVKVISAVGMDEKGREILDFINNEHIDSSLIQQSPSYPTGKATVFLNEQKTPDYIIHENVAWDHIAFSDALHQALQEHYDIFYCNVLVQRSIQSYETFKRVLPQVKARFKVFDMTLRKHYYTKEKIKLALTSVNVLKVNEEELSLIKTLFYPHHTFKDDKQALEQLQKDFNLSFVFLTLGEKGSALQGQKGFYTQAILEDIEVVDTVGAGDCFCAALCYGLACGKLCERDILALSSAMASAIVRFQGGVARIDVDGIKASFGL